MKHFDDEIFDLVSSYRGDVSFNRLSTGKGETLWRDDMHSALFQVNVVDLGDVQKVELFVNRSFVLLDEKAQELFGELPAGLLIFERQKYFEVRVKSMAEVKTGLNELVLQAYDWVREIELKSTLDELAASYPDNFPMRQVAHLVALVLKAEFMQIDDYKSAFKSGSSARFTNVITFEFLDKCFDEAVKLA